MTGCFWHEDPWFGDALVNQVDENPCFGLPENEIQDPKKTKISLILVSQGNSKLWRYDEDDYERMVFAANACLTYGSGSIAKNASADHGHKLRPGQVYRVLIRTTRAQDSFDRTFYRANFCIQHDSGNRVKIVKFKEFNFDDKVCPER